MTEAEWLECERLRPMLEVVVEGWPRRQVRRWLGGDRQRKLRLFLCARWRAEGIGIEESIVAAAERYAEGETSVQQLRQVRRDALRIWRAWAPWWRSGLYEAYARAVLSPWPLSAAAVDRLAAGGMFTLLGLEHRSVGLLREVFHPFRPWRGRPAWLTGTVRDIAAGIVAEQAYDRMGILADALEEGGCDDLALQAHCRSDQRHIRGCWALDRLLGRE